MHWYFQTHLLCNVLYSTGNQHKEPPSHTKKKIKQSSEKQSLFTRVFLTHNRASDLLLRRLYLYSRFSLCRISRGTGQCSRYRKILDIIEHSIILCTIIHKITSHNSEHDEVYAYGHKIIIRVNLTCKKYYALIESF